MNLSEEEKQKKILAYRKDNPRCTCEMHFSSYSGGLLVGYSRSDRSGCPGHCDHYGIRMGGRCPCGVKVNC